MNKTMFAILTVLEKQSDIVGSKEISKQLTLYGVDLTERTVRYHLKILDERGLQKFSVKREERLQKKVGKNYPNHMCQKRSVS